MFSGEDPHITPAQAIAVAQGIIALVVAFGFNVSPELQAALVQLSTVIAAILPAADAGLRASRNARDAKIGGR